MRRRWLKGGMLVEDVHIAGNASTGISVATATTATRDNRITNLDGTLQGGTSSGQVTAIYAENVWRSRMDVEIRNNSILGLKGTAGSTAITLFRAPATIVEGNTIAGLNSDAFTGVRIGHSNGVTIANNRSARG